MTLPHCGRATKPVPWPAHVPVECVKVASYFHGVITVEQITCVSHQRCRVLAQASYKSVMCSMMIVIVCNLPNAYFSFRFF